MPKQMTTSPVAEQLATWFSKHQTNAEQIDALCSPRIAVWDEIVSGRTLPNQDQCFVIAEAFLQAGRKRGKMVRPEPIRDRLLNLCGFVSA